MFRLKQYQSIKQNNKKLFLISEYYFEPLQIVVAVVAVHLRKAKNIHIQYLKETCECLMSGGRIDAGHWKHAPGQSTMQWVGNVGGYGYLPIEYLL